LAGNIKKLEIKKIFFNLKITLHTDLDTK